MRLRDILLAWQQAGAPDPALYEVQLVSAAPQPAPVAPPTQPQPAPAAFGAPPPVVIPGPLAQPTATAPALPFLTPSAPATADFAAERRARLTAEAQLFYRDQLAARKAVPAEEPHIVARYLQAATDDAEHGLAVFADGRQYARVAALRAEFAARPPSVYTQELVGGHLPQGASVLGPQFGQDPMAALVQQAQAQAKAYAERANGTARGGAA